MALIGEMQYLTIGGNTYSLPSGGGGTVTSVAVSNATNGGLSVSGSPISSSGTITIGHSNVLAAAQTTQAVYPIKIDKNGHISAYGSAVTISDTKNTAGSTDSNSKLFLIGATSQAANPQTYSHDTAYVGTDGYLYSNSKKTLVEQYGTDSTGIVITPNVISNDACGFSIYCNRNDNSNNVHQAMQFEIGASGIALTDMAAEKAFIRVLSEQSYPNGNVFITGLPTPSQNDMAANKKYVDDSIPTKVSELTNDSGYITSYTETDPTVPSWAKASSKPSYNFSEIGSIPTSISGYGITDAYTKSEVDGLVSGVLHYKGTKTTISALPSSGNTTGDVWHVTSDGSEWAWDGTTWQELGTAVDLSGYVPTSRTINSKTLTGNISLTASDVGALPSSTTIPSKTSDLTNDSGFVTTDEKLKTPVIGEDVGFRYFVLTTTNDSAETKIRSTGDLRYSLDEDSTLEIGSAYVPSKLVLHSGKGYSANTTIVSNEVISSATITLPIVSGTVALTSDIPTKTSDLTNDSGFINSIKTINNQSLIGSGNITVSTTAAQIIRWTESA